ncbi:hypothetical protein BDZ89DRAFT_1161558 [Hymenopellis radicata]|nr:hypothetical protein BDZ89DRAFT_1161558 [Hymenopellis radicata]
MMPFFRADACESPDPANTVTDRLNTLLNSSGPGYILRLCPSKQYLIQAPLVFTWPNQEISTLGYPTDDTRALLVVNGPVADGKGHTTAIEGNCATCSGIKIRNLQIDGTRQGASSTSGGGNIEIGGSNSDQLVEYVKTFDPRSWSCLHVAEGALSCNNVTIQNNDIGPCGSDSFEEWADGISYSCMNGIVRNNIVLGSTDGAIVLFGAPGTQVYNNTIAAVNQTLLGGINMVDYDPWNANFTGVVVRDNTILGGFATDLAAEGHTKGENNDHVITKIGIAIGPRTWFGSRYETNVSLSGTVIDNSFSGAFSYAIALTSAKNFTVTGNTLFGNTSFIGSPGPNCSDTDIPPTPQPFVMTANVTADGGGSTVQAGFDVVSNGDALTCVLPPDGGDYWPYGEQPSFGGDDVDNGSSTPSSLSHGDSSSGRIGGLIGGVIAGVLCVALFCWFFNRKWPLKQLERKRK